MKPQVIKCSFSKELFTYNRSKKKDQCVLSLGLSFFITNFIIYII